MWCFSQVEWIVYRRKKYWKQIMEMWITRYRLIHKLYHPDHQANLFSRPLDKKTSCRERTKQEESRLYLDAMVCKIYTQTIIAVTIYSVPVQRIQHVQSVDVGCRFDWRIFTAFVFFMVEYHAWCTVVFLISAKLLLISADFKSR